MNAQAILLLLLAILLAACAVEEAAPPAAPPAQPTAKILYVTPTGPPTLVPTAARFPPTDAPEAAQLDNCDLALEKFYAAASERCLSGPTDSFCNGGQALVSQPPAAALNAPGAVANLADIDSLHSPPLSAAGGGLVWLRQETDSQMAALLVGKARLSQRSPPASGAANWHSLIIETGKNGPAAAGCSALPALGALVIQGLYGQSARLTLNGVSAEINGTLIVLTQETLSKFIAIEGQVLLRAFGQAVSLNVGQQLNLLYAAGDWSRPVELPGQPIPLERQLIKHLPVVLFDRPLPIPQPGYAQTQGGVNMRAAPDINSRLLFQVPAGHTMGLLGISQDRQWLHIRFGNGETGWMSAELLARHLGQIEDVYDLTPAPPQRYGAYAYRAAVNVLAGGNLREAPDTAFAIKRTLPYGLQVKLLARSPYSPWVQVEADGETGWMALFTLETKSVISSLPIDYAAPLPPRATPTPSFSYGGGHAYPDPRGGF